MKTVAGVLLAMLAARAGAVTQEEAQKAAAIRKDGAIEIDGRAVFPVGYYHVSWVRGRSGETLRKDLALAAAAGADLFHPSLDLSPGVAALLDDARRFGVRFIPEMNPKILDAMVERHRGDPVVLAWNLGDDVTDRATVEQIRERRERVRRLDPKVLTYVSAYNSGEAWLGKPGASSWFKAGIDILGMQNYPIPWEPGVGNHNWCDFAPGGRDKGNHRARVFWGMKRTVDQAAAFGHRAVLANVQAFRWNREGPAWRWPTPEEFDNMTWQAVVAGVNGILYFTMHDPTNYLPDRPELWRQTAATTADLKKVAPLLLSGKRVVHPATEDASVRCVWATWSGADGDLLVVAVSVSDREEEVRIPLPAGVTGEPAAVFEHRPGLLKREGGDLRGTLPAGTVRILRVRR